MRLTTRLRTLCVHRLRPFAANREGNVAIIFALSLLPVMGAIGTGIDFSRASRIRTVMLAAADAASVGSIAKTSKAYNTASSMSGNGAIDAGDATDIFNAQMQNRSG